jgi:DNA-binding NarL/FixJ family response regulator
MDAVDPALSERSMPNHIRLVVVDDHPLVRDGLATVLSQCEDIDVVGQCATVAQALETVDTTSPDVVLLDMQLEDDEHGVQVARLLREKGSGVTILMLSVHGESRHLREAMAAGADGYLVKTTPAAELISGIRAAAAGRRVIDPQFAIKLLVDTRRGVPIHDSTLTEREQQVVEMVAGGHSNRAIAAEFAISIRTVHKHLGNLLRKLSASSRAELVAHAFREGIVC